MSFINNHTKSIIKIALPLIMQQLFFQFQIWIDRSLLGHLNTKYFSVIGNTIFPYYASLSFVIAISSGTTIMVAQYIGAKKIKEAKKVSESAFVGNSIISFIFFFIFFFCSESIFNILGVKSPILEFCVTYVSILSISFIFLGLESSAFAIFQGIGITKIIMYTGIAKNILNILLDWLLIYGNLGFPKLEIKGAAIATLIANLFFLPLIIIYSIKTSKIPFSLTLSGIIKFNPRKFLKIFKIGLPAGLENLIWYIGSLVILRYLNLIDSTASGIYALVFSIEIFPYLIYMGIAKAAMTLVGQKTGEANQYEAREIGLKCMKYSLFICLITAFAFILIPGIILGIFTNDNDLINESSVYLAIVSITMFPKAINNIIGYGIQGMGDTKWMLGGQILGTILVIITAFLFVFQFKLNIMGIFLALLIDESIRSIINLLRFLKGREFFLLKPFRNID